MFNAGRRTARPRAYSFLLVVAVCVISPNLSQSEVIGYHEVKTDATGRIAPWHGTTSGDAYDHVVRLVWAFWRDMGNCPNGVPIYLQHQVWKDEDPRGLGGDQISMALSSWNLLYDYLGDEQIKANMIRMADFWLANGFSKPTDLWANLPYPYNTELHSGKYDGDMRAGKNFLQPDKAGSFGAELVVLYKKTGDGRYLTAAVSIADSLVKHVQPGDAENSPWPFRVNALTGEVHHAKTKDGRPISASYTTNWTPTLRLLESLILLKQGNPGEYRRCMETVTAWLKQYPIKTNKWGPFFEDIPTGDYSDTEINADTLAFYILDHPEWDPMWKSQARGILNWSYTTFQNHEFDKWGASVINEQTVFLVPGNSHTSRHASTELRYCEATGECASKEDAIRRLNWATYTVDTDGKNRYIRDDIWLTDGYGDYVRHYLRAMAAAPELAPPGQNHLLRTSSVVKSISYAPDRISFTVFDRRSRELLRIGSGKPRQVMGGTMRWDPNTGVMIVQATGASVVIALQQ